MIGVLLDHGANIEARTTDGKTPLIVAVDEGHLEAAQLLLDRGADIEAKTNVS